MTNSHPSKSDSSQAFYLLDPRVQQWIWDQGWDELRDIQELAIRSLLNTDRDVIVSASTAAGKTEAAFLPICSRLATDRRPSIQALYIAPLKALINDQFYRLDNLCEHLEIPVTRWHGDVPASVKRKCLSRPEGILLTTPESLEAICVMHGNDVARIFRDLSVVVIDELHAFIGSERGKQLQSLIHRIEVAACIMPRRVGLSATLGDLSLAAVHLRGDDPDSVQLITSHESRQELRAQIRGYIRPDRPPSPESSEAEEVIDELGSDEIATHLFDNLRLTSNLIFANSRNNVESYSAILAGRCEEASLPVNYLPHHGNLSRELREDVERRLKDGNSPVNVVSTSTLELGIDIGMVDSVAQVGAPFSVSSLRQRMGRSGRRGQPAVLRMYIEEDEISARTHVFDSLRLQMIQSVSIMQLLVEGWCEPPSVRGLHLSTLVQQVLSLIAQYGGGGAPFLWRVLCQTGPFGNICKADFAILLRGFADHKLIQQTADGTIILAHVGERIVNHYSFYAAFSTPDEFRVFHGGRPLGTLPVDYAVLPGSYIIFAGRRWKVADVNAERKTIDLTPAGGGRAPKFKGSPGLVHDRVRLRMAELYREPNIPAFLDGTAKTLFAEARESYQRLKLETEPVMQSGKDVYLFHWCGDVVGYTLGLLLISRGIKATHMGPALWAIDTTVDAFKAVISAIAEEAFPDQAALVEVVPEKQIEKFDRFVAEALLNRGYAERMLDFDGTRAALTRIARYFG
jgi:ATP-dependent Lhr-like helicase